MKNKKINKFILKKNILLLLINYNLIIIKKELYKIRKYKYYKFFFKKHYNLYKNKLIIISFIIKNNIKYNRIIKYINNLGFNMSKKIKNNVIIFLNKKYCFLNKKYLKYIKIY
ncbi:hypothetical protein [Candidatus Shikimatogenerans bostrichidophilus]|uniref:hypothetical protein n=1 Tax=Candidatus Shikimatogenerans bostrichidophilus TaxID=2943807 RepID=UPI002965D3EC